MSSDQDPKKPAKPPDFPINQLLDEILKEVAQAAEQAFDNVKMQMGYPPKATVSEIIATEAKEGTAKALERLKELEKQLQTEINAINKEDAAAALQKTKANLAEMIKQLQEAIDTLQEQLKNPKNPKSKGSFDPDFTPEMTKKLDNMAIVLEEYSDRSEDEFDKNIRKKEKELDEEFEKYKKGLEAAIKTAIKQAEEIFRKAMNDASKSMAKVSAQTRNDIAKHMKESNAKMQQALSNIFPENEPKAQKNNEGPDFDAMLNEFKDNLEKSNKKINDTIKKFEEDNNKDLKDIIEQTKKNWNEFRKNMDRVSDSKCNDTEIQKIVQNIANKAVEIAKELETKVNEAVEKDTKERKQTGPKDSGTKKPTSETASKAKPK